ncbi:PIG-L deacetylase family protein [Chloroflexota bacterium]
MNVLVVCAHPDDEVLGAGGTLAKHNIAGDNVYSCLLCEQATIRNTKPEHESLLKQVNEAANIIGIKETMFFDFPDIRLNIVPILELVQSIEHAVIKFKPEVIYTHHTGDLTDDHKIVFDATMTAVRLPERRTRKELPSDLIKEVLCFEVPSATDWAVPLSGQVFRPNVFVDIKNTLKLKIKALEQYEKIIKEFPHPRSVENLETLAKYRGAQSGYELAESFMLMRMLR